MISGASGQARPPYQKALDSQKDAITDLQVAEEGADKPRASPKAGCFAADMCSHCLSDPIPQGCMEHYMELTTSMPFGMRLRESHPGTEGKD